MKPLQALPLAKSPLLLFVIGAVRTSGAPRSAFSAVRDAFDFAFLDVKGRDRARVFAGLGVADA